MDEKKFLNLLRNLQSIMRCPSCGSVYEAPEVQLMGGQDGHFVLSLSCSECFLPVWVNFFTGSGGAENYIQSDLTLKDLRLFSKGPISSSEVIDFHLSVCSFDGDFEKALKTRS